MSTFRHGLLIASFGGEPEAETVGDHHNQLSLGVSSLRLHRL